MPEAAPVEDIPRLIDLLDGWIARDDAGKGGSTSPLLADPQKLIWDLTARRVVRLGRIGRLTGLSFLANVTRLFGDDPEVKESALGMFSSVMSGMLGGGPRQKMEQFATAYEQMYGGVGEGYEGYRRGDRAIHIAGRLAADFDRFGENEVAMRLRLFAAGLACLPSWQRAQEAMITSIIERVESSQPPTPEDRKNPAFLLQYPVGMMMQDGLSREQREAWLGAYVFHNWPYYDFEIRKRFDSFKARMLNDPLAASLGGTEPQAVFAPEHFVGLLEEMLQETTRREAAFFLTRFDRARAFDVPRRGAASGSAVDILLEYCRGEDPWFVAALDAEMHGERAPAFANPLMRAGWEQLFETVKLVGSLAEQGVPAQQIRRQIVANSSALQYTCTRLRSQDNNSKRLLNLVYGLASCPDTPGLDGLITAHADALDEEFLLYAHYEQGAIDLQERADQERSNPSSGDLQRLRRRVRIIIKTVSRDAAGSVIINREQLRTECAVEVLLHQVLAGWSPYRRAEAICSVIPYISDAVLAALTPRLRTVAGEARRVVTATVLLCHRLAAARARGAPAAALAESVRLSFASPEAVEHYTILGPLHHAPALRGFWLMLSRAHADGEGTYALQIDFGRLAQEGRLLTTKPTDGVWGTYRDRLAAAHEQGNDAALLEFITQRCGGPSADSEEQYLRAYLHATAAVVKLARGEDPRVDIGHSLGYAAQVGVSALIPLAFPCWLVLVHYGTAQPLQLEPFEAALADQTQVTGPTAGSLLRQILPAFDALALLRQSCHDLVVRRRLLAELAEVEATCAPVMEQWSLRAWMDRWLEYQQLA